MTKASDNAFPSILITEGTEPSAPAAGKQRLYIDSTTHKLKRTDSSGVDVTIESSGSGDVATDTIWDAAGDLAVGTGANTAAKLTLGAAGGAVSRINGAVAWNSGTSFPTAATGDRYWRTDRGMEYYYDGTRWLCTCPHVMPMRQWQNVSGSDTLSSIYPVPGGGGANGIYLVSFRGYFLQGGGTSATNYMTASLHRWDASTDTADVSTVSSQNNTVGDFTIESATINAVLTSGTDALDVKLTETGSVTGFYGTTEIEYRFIG